MPGWLAILSFCLGAALLVIVGIVLSILLIRFAWWMTGLFRWYP